MKNIHEIKEAMKEPASKEWFKKYGLPKGLGPKKHEVAGKMPIAKFKSVSGNMSDIMAKKKANRERIEAKKREDYENHK